MAMEIPSEIRHLIDNNEFEAAIVGLNDAIEADLCNVACYLERARLNWKLGRRREAINDYYKAAELDRDGPARQALEHISGIMQFYNKDLYNP